MVFITNKRAIEQLKVVPMHHGNNMYSAKLATHSIDNDNISDIVSHINSSHEQLETPLNTVEMPLYSSSLTHPNLSSRKILGAVSTTISLVSENGKKQHHQGNQRQNGYNKFKTKIDLEQICNKSISQSSNNLQTSSEIKPKGPSWNRQLSNESQEQQDNPNKKPWWIWFIGGMDILATAWYTGLFLFSIPRKENSDPYVQILQIPVLLTRYFMGFTIHVGLNSEKTSHTAFCFKFWIVCHLMFFASFAVDVIVEIQFYATLHHNFARLPRKEHTPPITFLVILIAFVYRVITVIVVMFFLGTAKQFECVELDNVAICENEGENQKEIHKQKARN